MEQQEQCYIYEGGVRDVRASDSDNETSYDGVAGNADEASYLKQIHETFE
ncbi:hypothetical protein HN747_04595 [archaeon]|jgi:hypothetical protein|nr:hypothetical protein [archaeon]